MCPEEPEILMNSTVTLMVIIGHHLTETFRGHEVKTYMPSLLLSPSPILLTYFISLVSFAVYTYTIHCLFILFYISPH